MTLEGNTAAPCFRDPAALRPDTFVSQCTTITAGSAAIRLLFVTAKKLTLRNLVFLGGSPKDSLEGGCVHVKGQLVAFNVAFVNCSASGVRPRSVLAPARPGTCLRLLHSGSAMAAGRC